MSEFFDTPLSDVIALQNDKKAQLKTFEYQSSGVLPIIDQSSKFICGYTDDFSKKYSKSLPVIVFGDHTLHTKYIDFDFAVGADGTQIIRTQDPQHEHKYLYYVISREIQIMGSEGYKRHLKILKERVVPFTNSIPEQKKIASILTSVDEVIENTQKQIDKLQDLKKATMNELLTKGIGHTEFKDSEFGRIPKSWEVASFANVCSLIRDGTHLPPARVKRGVPLLSIRNMQDGRFELLADDTYVSEDFYSKMHSKWKPEEGDLLLAVVGATIGKVCQVPKGLPRFTLQRSVAVLRGTTNLLDNDYLFLCSQSQDFNKRLWDRVNQTAQPGIYLAEIAKIKIPLPPVDEQLRITSAIGSVSVAIDSQKHKLSQTKSLKKSLMQDLLTGKVRVTVN